MLLDFRVTESHSVGGIALISEFDSFCAVLRECGECKAVFVDPFALDQESRA